VDFHPLPLWGDKGGDMCYNSNAIFNAYYKKEKTHVPNLSEHCIVFD
jgi:hypothetical protein